MYQFACFHAFSQSLISVLSPTVVAIGLEPISKIARERRVLKDCDFLYSFRSSRKSGIRGLSRLFPAGTAIFSARDCDFLRAHPLTLLPNTKFQISSASLRLARLGRKSQPRVRGGIPALRRRLRRGESGGSHDEKPAACGSTRLTIPRNSRDSRNLELLAAYGVSGWALSSLRSLRKPRALGRSTYSSGKNPASRRKNPGKSPKGLRFPKFASLTKEIGSLRPIFEMGSKFLMFF